MNSDPLQPDEIQLFRSRTIIIGTIITLIFSLLASRLWYLQVLSGEVYADFSKGNRIRIIPQAAPRGIIYDRNGIALADNRPAYQLQLIREDTPDLEKTLNNLVKVLQIPYAALRKKVEDNRYLAPFKPIILEEDLDYQKAVLVETFQEDFPGISIVVQSRRFYPYNKVASHILGYVGIRNEEQELQLPSNKRSSGQIVGKAGIELIKNDALVGTDGGKQIEVDHVGRELRVLNKPVNPIPGNDVHLTIDIRIQQLIYDAMKGKTGAVIVMNPKTGHILAMGSFPSYNPNLFAAGINRKNWNRLVSNPQHPLENKVIQGTYPPGSIFKLVTAYAGLDLGIITKDTTHTCNGVFYIKGRRTPFKCWKGQGHGTLNLKQAIEGSCNVFFWQVGQEVGINNLHHYAKKFGLGNKSGIRLLDEKEGLIPNEEWKRRALGEQWFLGDTPPVSIGQGYLNVTPIQILNLVNIIANNGFRVMPILLLDDSNIPSPQPLNLSQEYLTLIREGMIEVVNGKHGTARVVRHSTFTIAGKTATAQVVSHKTLAALDEEKRQERYLQNHAMFVAFGPAENPELSVAVVVEHGGAGAKEAAPIAKRIFEYYVKNIYISSEQSPAFQGNLPYSHQLHGAFIQRKSQ